MCVTPDATARASGGVLHVSALSEPACLSCIVQRPSVLTGSDVTVSPLQGSVVLKTTQLRAIVAGLAHQFDMWLLRTVTPALPTADVTSEPLSAAVQ